MLEISISLSQLVASTESSTIEEMREGTRGWTPALQAVVKIAREHPYEERQRRGNTLANQLGTDTEWLTLNADQIGEGTVESQLLRLFTPMIWLLSDEALERLNNALPHQA